MMSSMNAIKYAAVLNLTLPQQHRSDDNANGVSAGDCLWSSTPIEYCNFRQWGNSRRITRGNQLMKKGEKERLSWENQQRNRFKAFWLLGIYWECVLLLFNEFFDETMWNSQKNLKQIKVFDLKKQLTAFFEHTVTFFLKEHKGVDFLLKFSTWTH